MTSFKEFLAEVALIPDIKKSDKLSVGDHLGRGLWTVDDDAKRFDLAGGVVTIESSRIPGISAVTFFYKKTARITLYLRKGNRNVFKIDEVSSKKSPLKVYELYAFLIKKLGYTLTTNTQSEGGKRVWEELSKAPGISVHGWDPMSKTPVNTAPGLEDDDVHANIYRHETNVDVKFADRIVLVASPSK